MLFVIMKVLTELLKDSEFMQDNAKAAETFRQPELSNKINLLFEQGRIKDAFLLLRKKGSSHPQTLSRVNEMERTYLMLLKYFLSGRPDESRERVIEDMRNEMLFLADRVERNSLLSSGPESYYAESRIISYRPRSLQAMLEEYDQLSTRILLSAEVGDSLSDDIKKREALLDSIFLYVWTMGYDSDEDLKMLRDAVISSETIDPMLGPQVVAALFLALNTWYDSRKLRTLFNIYESAATEKLAARALTVIVLVLSRWPERIRRDRKVMEMLSSLKDSLLSYSRLREVIRVLIRTRDTDRISDKMRSQVIPEMMKLSPEMLRKMKDISADGDIASLEDNPEWEELLQKNGLADKLRELSELQMDGADVMMVAFSNLKNFPFFSRMSHWFLPFTTRYSDFLTGPASEFLKEGSPLMRILSMEGIMSDSDKYSFLLAVGSMPEERRNAMAMQIEMQQQQMAEGFDALPKAPARAEFDTETEKFARDLYRFFKLFPRKGEFADPFRLPLDFLRLPVVGDILDELEVLELVAEFYFKRGYYGEAAPMFRILAEAKGDNPHFWEKFGYSIEKSSGDQDEALACYMKAELFSPDSKWLQRRIGMIYRNKGNWPMALDYIEKAVGESDKNADLLLLAELSDACGDSKNALKYLYKADYVNPGDVEVVRRIVDYELNSGNFPKALEKLKRVPSGSFTDGDFRTQGHLLFLQGKFEEAADSYRRTIREDHKHREWKRQILDDMPRLEKLGARRSDMLLLLDSLV